MFNKIIYFARASDSSSLLDYVRVISTPIIIIIIIIIFCMKVTIKLKQGRCMTIKL